MTLYHHKRSQKGKRRLGFILIFTSTSETAIQVVISILANFSLSMFQLLLLLQLLFNLQFLFLLP